MTYSDKTQNNWPEHKSTGPNNTRKTNPKAVHLWELFMHTIVHNLLYYTILYSTEQFG